jgi:hypothetical protein
VPILFWSFTATTAFGLDSVVDTRKRNTNTQLQPPPGASNFDIKSRKREKSLELRSQYFFCPPCSSSFGPTTKTILNKNHLRKNGKL